MRLTLVLPFDQSATHTPFWADEESDVDFDRDPERAARCTLSFAAVELRRHLQDGIAGLDCVFDHQPPRRGRFIRLLVDEVSSRDDRFAIEPEGSGIRIRGKGRTGALYGAYELLRLQGWRWIHPGPRGVRRPPPRRTLVLPDRRLRGKPGFPLGRGFDFEKMSMESREMLLWMARNRLNVASYRTSTHAFACKLGMKFKNGGHIFEALMDPDRPAGSGGTLWEMHRDWYGLPESGRRTKDRALKTQFCVSNREGVAYLSEHVVRRLEREWRGVDLLDIWPFDTWGASCECRRCRALGNDSDKLLHFGAALRTHIRNATEAGRLARPVRLILCAYEGTCSLEPPENPVPEALVAAQDAIVFYPINRCYEHDFHDPGCKENVRYARALDGWLQCRPSLPVILGEYYNVSKFEDLPLLFTRRVARDLPRYAASGVSGMTYMHVPMLLWAMRASTQGLYAELAWNGKSDASRWLAEYFRALYGPHAAAVQRSYALIESAWERISDWRIWSERSVISQLLVWDGKRPSKPLKCAGTHFASPSAMIREGRCAEEKMREASLILDRCHAEVFRSVARVSASLPIRSEAVNPAELQRQTEGNALLEQLADDRRLLAYGLGVMALTTETVAYHEALRRGRQSAAETAWTRIQPLVEDLDGRWIPLTYHGAVAGFECRDALTRSQLRATLLRCAGHREGS